VPLLVRTAATVDDLRFVTASQVLDAYVADEANKPVFIDVRTSAEFAAAHVSGALNIQDFQIPDAISSLPREQAWVLYCTCPDDHLAKWGAAAIGQAGFGNALVLEQGLQAWHNAGGPITTSGDNAISQGCGCSVEADAFKLWAIDRAQRGLPQYQK
jgi:rhodanese-related sulfurtransferase